MYQNRSITQAIETTYFPWTETKPPRIRAKCNARTRFYGWDDFHRTAAGEYGWETGHEPGQTALNQSETHQAAALRLAGELGWSGDHRALISGGGHGKGFFHCFFDPDFEAEHHKNPFPSYEVTELYHQTRTHYADDE